MYVFSSNIDIFVGGCFFRYFGLHSYVLKTTNVQRAHRGGNACGLSVLVNVMLNFNIDNMYIIDRFK